MNGRRKLTLDDIADVRAYERERSAFRRTVVDQRRRRRVELGPLATLVFENRDTVRFHLQEMLRLAGPLDDDAVEAELAACNPLIPEPGQLCATMFLASSSAATIDEWWPELAGVERSVVMRIDDPAVAGPAVELRATPLVAGGRAGVDDRAPTPRERPSAANSPPPLFGPAQAQAQEAERVVVRTVHFVRFDLDEAVVHAFRGGQVALAIDHATYAHEAAVGADSKAELLADLGVVPGPGL